MGVSEHSCSEINLRHHRPLFEQPAAPASHQRSAAHSLSSRVLRLEVEQMTLIKGRERALGAQVKPILRDSK